MLEKAQSTGDLVLDKHLFNMVFSAAEKELIKTCYVEKGLLGTRIVPELPGKRWNCHSANRVIQLERMDLLQDSLGVEGQELHLLEVKNYKEENIQSQDNQLGPISHTGKLEMQLGLVKHQSIESPKNLISKHTNKFECPGEMKL